jgi:hypothetical protein
MGTGFKGGRQQGVMGTGFKGGRQQGVMGTGFKGGRRQGAMGTGGHRGPPYVSTANRRVGLRADHVMQRTDSP